MSDPLPAPPAETSRPDFRRLVTTIVVVGLILVAGYSYISGRRSRDVAEARLAEQVSQNAELQKSMANLQEVVTDLKTSKLYQAQEQAVARDTSLSAAQIAESAETRIADLRQAVQTLEVQRADMLSGDTGRRIASDWQLVERMERLLSPYLPTNATADQLGQRLENLMQPVRQAIEQNTAYTPSADLQQRVQAIETEASERLVETQNVTRDLAALLQEASALNPSESLTLQTALDGLQAHRDDERRRVEDEALAEIRRAGNQLIAEQKAEAQQKIDAATAEATRLAGEQAAARIVADAEAEKKRQEEALAAQAEADARAAEEAEFEKALPDIKYYLSAFVEDGTSYSTNPGQPGPVSYAVISKWQVFQEGRFGLEGLMYVASVQNGRSQGPIPTYVGSAQAFERNNTPELRKAHGLMLKWGRKMVETGLLAP